MLVLQRRIGERIVLSGGIEITITAISKRGVRLAVSAPRGISVLRGEVYDAVAAANAQAATSESDGGSPTAAPASGEVGNPPGGVR